MHPQEILSRSISKYDDVDLEPEILEIMTPASGSVQRIAQYAKHLLSPSVIEWLKVRRNRVQRDIRNRMRLRMIERYGTFSAKDLVVACRAAGIRENGVLFAQSSFTDLVTYDGTPYELLEALLELAGPQGTLLMPAYSTNMSVTPCRPFDVRREPTYTGIIPELFRREDGVIRSLHPRHSICGRGPLAAELLRGHEDCIYADGVDSPFDRLRKLNAQSLCLGMFPGWNSFLHWVEDFEPEKYPIIAHEGPFECTLYDESGRELRRPFYRCPAGQINQDRLVGRHLGADAIRVLKIHGVDVSLYNWPAFASELLRLRDCGIIRSAEA